MKRMIAGLLITTATLAPASLALAHTAYPDGSVYIRSGPGTDYAILGRLDEGQSAAILAHEGSWLKVRAPGGVEGYMADWVTREVFDDEPAYVRVNTDVLNLRTGPGTDYAVAGRATQDQRFRLLEAMGDWAKLDGGSLGQVWVARQYLARVTQPPASQPPVTPPPEVGGGGGQSSPEAANKAVMAAIDTTLYAGRDNRTAKNGTARTGEQLTYLDAAEGWVKVENRAGDRGWVSGTDVGLWDRGVEFSRQAAYTMQEGDWREAYLRVRQVTPDGDGLRLRSGPSADSDVRRPLAAGDRMKLLQVPDGEFVQVVLETGETGWVSRRYLMPLQGLSLPTESVRLYQAAPGVLRLEVTGQTESASVSAADGALQVALPANSGRHAAMIIGQYDAAELRMQSGGVALTFTRPFVYQVVEQSAARTVVEIRPQVDRVETVTGKDRTSYRIFKTGSMDPVISKRDGVVTLTMPGALLAPGMAGAALPQGLSLRETESGVAASVATSRPYEVKTSSGYVEIVVYSPGLAGKTIVVDPGHGGVESGAVGKNGLQEKDSNLAIALKVRDLLQAAGATVIMTRTSDTRCSTPDELAAIPESERLRYDLNCRTVVANRNSADAFISVHSNANPTPVDEHGTETYWTDENRNAPRSQELAAAIQQQMVGALGLTDRGVKNDMFYVTKYSEAPSALAEVAFVDWPSEEALLKQDGFRQKAAEAIFRGIQNFFK